MAKPIPYSPGQAGEVAHQQQTSVAETLENGVEIAYENAKDNSGWANQFAPANISGIMLRVTATGSTPPSGGVNWTAANTKIPHNLGYVPIGFLVTYKSKTCDVFAGSSAPDSQFIYLTITDDTANTNLFIF